MARIILEKDQVLNMLYEMYATVSPADQGEEVSDKFRKKWEALVFFIDHAPLEKSGGSLPKMVARRG